MFCQMFFMLFLVLWLTSTYVSSNFFWLFVNIIIAIIKVQVLPMFVKHSTNFEDLILKKEHSHIFQKKFVFFFFKKCFIF
jgi:hypothetical protein